MSKGSIGKQIPVWFLSFTSCFLLSCGGGTSTPPPPPGNGKIPVVAHVFLLIEENHAYGSVIGNTAMPYTNSLAQHYALATQYFSNQHPSLPNYFWLTVGAAVATDDGFTGTVSADNVVRAITSAGKTWKIYAESLPSAGYLGPDVIPYARHHNPFTYISDVIGSSAQTGNIVPFTQLATDLQNNTLPDYAMILPNLANDAHDCPHEAASCSDTQKLANTDSWVQNNLDPLIKSSAFQNSVLIYTWDESDINDNANGGGHVATILVSPKVRTGYQSTTLYHHQSTLKLTMQLLGVTDYPGAASSAPDMSEFF